MAVSFDTLVKNTLQTTQTIATTFAENIAFHRLTQQAVTSFFDVQRKTIDMQAALFSLAGLPSANDLERLQRRVRSLMRRLEQLEDDLDRQTVSSAELTALKEELAQMKKQLAVRKVASGRKKASASQTVSAKTKNAS